MTTNEEFAADIRSLGIEVLGGPPLDLSRPLAKHLQDLGYSKPRQVTTVEELDALPVGTIVLDSERDVCERMSFGWFVIVKEEGSSPWLLDGAEDVELPATVLYVGGSL